MRKLIADAVVADGIEILVKEVPLFSPEFEEKIGALATDEAKASEMEHAIRHEISVHVEENPAFYQSLRERLEALIEERRSSPPATMPATATSLPISMRQSHDPPPAPREFVSGESVLYLGRHYRLKVHGGETGAAKLRGGWLHVPAPRGAERTEHVRTALVAWFRRHAAARLPERVAAWRAKAGVELPRVVISDQRKRWGSCDRNGTIRLNWRIIQAPMRLIDYVVVHELIHLRHRDQADDGGGVVRRWERVLPCPRRGTSANRRQRPA